MLEGKVLKPFNDKENNLKRYDVGKKFKAEEKRYKELYVKGFVDSGITIEEKAKDISKIKKATAEK